LVRKKTIYITKILTKEWVKVFPFVLFNGTKELGGINNNMKRYAKTIKP